MLAPEEVAVASAGLDRDQSHVVEVEAMAVGPERELVDVVRERDWRSDRADGMY